MNPVELEDLSPEAKRRRQQNSKAQSATPQNDDVNTRTEDGNVGDGLDADGTIPTWSYATAAWLAILGLPFLAFPRFLLFLSTTSSGGFREHLTPLENFLSTHFAIFALSVAIGLVFSVPQETNGISQANHQQSGYPIIIVPLTGGFLLSSFLSYNTSSSQLGPLALFMCVGSGSIGLLGLYAILFTGSSSRSKKTGADKRTSRFLFGNRSAAAAQKKQWKREHGK
ncbi:hypothetical protein M422DRAFT_30594 [Sphaerobolus stellatus SS14]|uniref:Transmembrane protein n=1 Tax=Sphaerobolus stellatus (strain SS14) TaxID=990650 RepID=A0A0C9VAQ9_SPHS4|nr:hypothetical protein M422DRAFT_30594 [Sphaerobolus stellatus SS14]